LIQDGSGAPLGRPNLFVAMCDYSATEELLSIVVTAIDDLGRAEIEGIEAEQCADLIETLVSSLLPLHIQEQARPVVCSSAEKMLSDYGDALSLDEIECVIAALSEYGIDENSAAAAADHALRDYIGNLWENLGSVYSLYGLQNRRERLDELVNSYGLGNYDRDSIDGEFERRRHEINVEEDRHYGGYSRSRSSQGVDMQITNDQIRSMFGNLRL
jgi:hypothetical protein